VTHHSCVWSSYENGCGANAGEDEDEFWYMGMAPCFRANAAYSLYGVLKGQNDSGCNHKTFINSFMTKAGLESFTSAVAAAGISFENSNDNSNNDYDYENYNDANDQANYEQYNNEQDQNYYQGGISASCSLVESNGGGQGENQIRLNEDYTSTGVTCSADGNYVQAFFNGAYCSSTQKIGVSNAMKTFNQDIAEATCVPIYNVNSYETYLTNDNQDGENDNAENPLSLLYHSHSCSVAEFSQGCPDPYGKVHQYEKALTSSTGGKHNRMREQMREGASWMLLLFGIAILLIPLLLTRRRKVKRRQKTPREVLYEREMEKATVKKRTLWVRILHSMKTRNNDNKNKPIVDTDASSP